ncbi:Hypothetical protein D9617_1g083210 [Elsinoe fawcettii]|nr:Hypothetical protein D9617_1g083210 [Elsinoe fawcettii]
MSLPFALGQGSYVNEENMRNTGIAMLVITSVVVATRTTLTVFQQKSVRWDDGWLLAGYTFFVAMEIMYLVKAEPIFNFWGVIDGTKPLYPTLPKDDVTMRKVSVAANMLFYSGLWSVKFSLLAFYKQLMSRIKTYVRAWWVVLVFSIVVYIVAIFISAFGCSRPQDATTSGGCQKPRDFQSVAAALWFGYTADVVTDICIMILPLGLIRKAKMPLRQKVSIGFVICLVAVCITIATIRVVEIGRTITRYSQPSATWLALWGTIELSLAVIIGSCPGLYRGGKHAHKTYMSSRSRSSHRSAKSDSPMVEAGRYRHVDIGPYIAAKRATMEAQHNASLPQQPHFMDRRSSDDTATSQEEFVRRVHDESAIAIHKTLSVKSRNRDSDSVKEWDDPTLPLPVDWDDPRYIGYPSPTANRRLIISVVRSFGEDIKATTNSDFGGMLSPLLRRCPTKLAALTSAVPKLHHAIPRSTIPIARRMSSSPTPVSSFTLDPSLFNPSLYTQLHSTWFSTQPPHLSAPSKESFQRWFSNPDKSAAANFDTLCTTNFAPALRSISPTHLLVPPISSYEEELSLAPTLAAPFLPQLPRSSSPEYGSTALALVLLLDQIPRNTLRSSQAQIYTHYDVLARALVRCLLTPPHRADLAPGIKTLLSKRMWFYLPLEHSEWLADHELFARYSEEMRADQELNCSKEVEEGLNASEGFEERHAVIIRRFGRYPYRNEVLGRETTGEEREWLEGGGERFTA